VRITSRRCWPCNASRCPSCSWAMAMMPRQQQQQQQREQQLQRQQVAPPSCHKSYVICLSICRSCDAARRCNRRRHAHRAVPHPWIWAIYPSICPSCDGDCAPIKRKSTTSSCTAPNPAASRRHLPATPCGRSRSWPASWVSTHNYYSILKKPHLITSNYLQVITSN